MLMNLTTVFFIFLGVLGVLLMATAQGKARLLSEKALVIWTTVAFIIIIGKKIDRPSYIPFERPMCLLALVLGIGFASFGKLTSTGVSLRSEPLAKDVGSPQAKYGGPD